MKHRILDTILGGALAAAFALSSVSIAAQPTRLVVAFPPAVRPIPWRAFWPRSLKQNSKPPSSLKTSRGQTEPSPPTM